MYKFGLTHQPLCNFLNRYFKTTSENMKEWMNRLAETDMKVFLKCCDVKLANATDNSNRERVENLTMTVNHDSVFILGLAWVFAPWQWWWRLLHHATSRLPLSNGGAECKMKKFAEKIDFGNRTRICFCFSFKLGRRPEKNVRYM